MAEFNKSQLQKSRWEFYSTHLLAIECASRCSDQRILITSITRAVSEITNTSYLSPNEKLDLLKTILESLNPENRIPLGMEMRQSYTRANSHTITHQAFEILAEIIRPIEAEFMLKNIIESWTMSQIKAVWRRFKNGNLYTSEAGIDALHREILKVNETMLLHPETFCNIIRSIFKQYIHL